MGENVVFKSTARKVRRLFGGKVVAGFAGNVSDAFALCDRFEEKLTQYGGNLERAAVSLAQMWRSEQGMRQLESLLIVADKDTLLMISGTGEVIDPDGGVVARTRSLPLPQPALASAPPAAPRTLLAAPRDLEQASLCGE